MQDNLKNIRNLSPGILANLSKLIVNRVGKSKDACMLTRDIIGFVSPKQTYRFAPDITLQLSTLSSRTYQPEHVIAKPPYAVLTGDWCSQENTFNSNANILGGMGMLVLHDNQSAQIPVVTATRDNLAFYNGRLLAVDLVII